MILWSRPATIGGTPGTSGSGSARRSGSRRCPSHFRLDYWFGAPLSPPPAEQVDFEARFADELEARTQNLIHVAPRALWPRARRTP